MWLRTGDVVRGFQVIWPFITPKMVRTESALQAFQLKEGSHFYYSIEAIREYLLNRGDVSEPKIHEALHVMGVTT